MRQDDTFIEFVCDQLEPIDGIVHRSMFGGYGLYCGSVFFGIAYRGRLYLKTDDATRPKFEEWGSEPFQPNSKQRLRSYYEVPEEMIDQPEELVPLAEEAIEVVLKA